jgi:predicted HAD superfamily Cof-like phosphohydrolase
LRHAVGELDLQWDGPHRGTGQRRDRSARGARPRTVPAQPQGVQGQLPLFVSEMVEQFHLTFGIPIRCEPTMLVPSSEKELRIHLLEEELCEFEDAIEANDLVAVADGLADIAYVLYGTALTFGIDLDAVVAEVHRSNMSKLSGGKPIYRSDGKVLKGPQYNPPDIAAVLARRSPKRLSRF